MAGSNLQRIVNAVVSIPSELARRPEARLELLVRESGYFAVHKQVTESAIRERMALQPELVSTWIGHSEDQRVDEGWYLMQEPTGYLVGYLGSKTVGAQKTHFSDGTEACAVFIKRYLEWIRSHA